MTATNSSTSREILPPLIDTIKVRGPVLRYDPTTVRLTRLTDLDTGEVDERNESAVYRLDSGICVKVDHLSDQPMASWEFSVPRAVRGENTRGATLAEMKEALDWVYSEAQRWVTWGCASADLRVMRIDLVSDIYVGDVAAILGALSQCGSRRAVKSALHSGHDVETLRRGYPGRWVVQAYDKHLEVLSTARRTRDNHRRALLQSRASDVRGVLRTEVQLRHHILKKRGVHVVRDATERGLNEIGRHYRHVAGLDSVLAGEDAMDRSVKALLHGPDHRQAAAVLGTLFVMGLGGDVRQLGDAKTLRKRLAIADLYGLTPGIFNAAPGPSIRLDCALNRVEEVAE